MSGELIIALVALGGVILAQWVTIHVNRQNLDHQKDGDNHHLDWATRNRNSLQEAVKILSKIIKES